jgi:hypothetical protein
MTRMHADQNGKAMEGAHRQRVRTPPIAGPDSASVLFA